MFFFEFYDSSYITVNCSSLFLTSLFFILSQVCTNQVPNTPCTNHNRAMIWSLGPYKFFLQFYHLVIHRKTINHYNIIYSEYTVSCGDFIACWWYFTSRWFYTSIFYLVLYYTLILDSSVNTFITDHCDLLNNLLCLFLFYCILKMVICGLFSSSSIKISNQ